MQVRSAYGHAARTPHQGRQNVRSLLRSYLTPRQSPAVSPVVTQKQPERRAQPEQPAAELAVAMECVGSLLQAYGQYAFDTELHSADELRALVQQWKMHALIGAKHPEPDRSVPGAGIADRDWSGVARFFTESRREETAFAVRGHRNLRDSLWAFVGALHHLVVQENVDDRVAREQIARVRAAVTSQDTELLKRESLSALSALETLMSARQARQQEHFSALADKVRGLGTELEEARRENHTDALTGLPNRKEFDERVRKTLQLHAMTGLPACLMMVDIDCFKTINDSHGHPAGDEALRLASRAMARTVLRKIDFVCRYGGDEFAIILQETDERAARALGSRLQHALRDLLDNHRSNEHELDYTLSVGIAELALGDDASAWTQRADQALYRAKEGGRNRVAV